jgi:hypothetical protein
LYEKKIEMDRTTEFLTIKQASEWATGYIGKNVTIYKLAV